MATKFLTRFKFGANISGRRAFRAYKAGEYEAMYNALKYIKPSNFIKSTDEDMTILHHAAATNNLEGVDALKELPYFHEIIDDSSNEYEWTPILWASTKKHFPMVKKLKRLGANTMKPKKDGITCMHIAATNNDVHILDYLLQHRPTKSIDVENNEGWTPAHFAAFMGNYDSLNLLMEHNADFWHKHQHKMNVFEEIVRSNDANLLEGVYNLYKSKPRNLNQEGGYSLLHLAAGSDCISVLKFLISKDEDVKQICNNKDGATPLHFAMLSNSYGSAKLLLQAGANPNGKDSSGNTPYHFAVSSKNRQLMTLIEESGGDATIENDANISPIDYAGIQDVKAGKLFFVTIPKYLRIMQENSYID